MNEIIAIAGMVLGSALLIAGAIIYYMEQDSKRW